MKFFRVGIENVGLNRRAASRGSSAASRRTSCSRSSRLILAAAISSRSLSGCASRTSRTVRPAFSCRIIDRNTRLDIIDVHAEQHSLALILDGFRLHQDAGGNQIIALKNRRYAVHDMVSGFFHIIGCQIFKWQHSLYVQIAGSGNQVFDIGILRRKLVADQMTAVIEILSIHIVILRRMPARRLDFPDRAALLRRHRVLRNRSICHAAAPQAVQITVTLK